MNAEALFTVIMVITPLHGIKSFNLKRMSKFLIATKVGLSCAEGAKFTRSCEQLFGRQTMRGKYPFKTFLNCGQCVNHLINETGQSSTC